MESSLNAARRARDLDALAGGTVVDTLVVGGGVTGAWVALDAASRGLTVALVERRDLANGTSRWSSKLVHGGLRYLAKGQVGVAYESAAERGILMERTACHLVSPLAMLAPVGTGYGLGRAAGAATGFALGDLLRAASRTRRRTLPGPGWVGAARAGQLVPGLRRDGLRGAVVSWDGQLVDDARLVVAIARTAAARGARILTYCAAEAVDGTGALVLDERTGTRFQLRARHVVNATGVWADRLHPGLALRPSRGTHLVVPAGRLGHPRAAFTVPVAGTANRYVFALPRPDGHVLVGVTDDLAEAVDDEPAAPETDAAFLLSAINVVLRDPLLPSDVVGSFAGLRPLLAGATSASTSDLSRRHQLLEGPEGLLTIVGGKLTTARRMAQDTVDRIAARPGMHARPCTTAQRPLVGAARPEAVRAIAAPPHLVRRFGTEAPAVLDLAAAEPDLAEPVVDGLPYLLAELRWAVDHEGALTIDDLLDRRTRIGLVAADRATAVARVDGRIPLPAPP